MQSKFREPVSGLTHVFGAIMSIIGLILLMMLSISNSTRFVIFTIFGVSLIMLYSASSIYHLVNFSEKTIFLLRKLDHSMIYVLIAGTYTPVCLIALNGILGWGLFIGIWVLAILGIILKMFWMEAPRWLYTMFYVFMGWISIFVIAPLAKIVPVSGIIWLFAGGVLYTLGAVIYAAKWPRINSKIFGFHEIFHIYVLMGSFCHYWFMLKYVMNI
jgi:channel protein, hemolysin III family